MDKISLLFAIEAEQLLLAGMTDEAIDLCEDGINAFPDYLAGYVVIIKAFIDTKQIEKASSYLSTALDYFPANQLLVEFKEIIDSTELNNIYISNLTDIVADDFDNPIQINDVNDELDLINIDNDSLQSEYYSNDNYLVTDSIETENFELNIEDLEIISDKELSDKAISEQVKTDFAEIPAINPIEKSIDAVDILNELKNDNDLLPIEVAATEPLDDIDSLLIDIQNDISYTDDNSYQVTSNEVIELSDEYITILNNEPINNSTKSNETTCNFDIFDNNIDELPKNDSKGFLKFLAYRRINQSNEDSLLKSNNLAIIPGLVDYQFYDTIFVSANCDDNFKLASKFVLSEIEKKYQKHNVKDNQFTILAEKIKLIEIASANPIEYSDEEDEEKPDEQTFIEAAPATETMAKILTIQKEYSKAVEVYKKLLVSNPENSKLYNSKILELQKMID